MPAGITAELNQTELIVTPSTPQTVMLTLSVAENAEPGEYALNVHANTVGSGLGFEIGAGPVLYLTVT